MCSFFKWFFRYLGMIHCPENQFTCRDKRCIADWKKCDGNNDCGDFSDEIYPCSGMANDDCFVYNRIAFKQKPSYKYN